MKRFLSVALAFLMLAVMLPVTALAANDYVTGSGINGFANRQLRLLKKHTTKLTKS